MKARYVPLVLIALTLWLVLPQPGAAPVAVAASGGPAAQFPAHPGRQPGAAIAALGPMIPYAYLPLIRYDPFTCSTSETYGTFPQAGGTDTIPAAQHPDKNLAVRGYVTVTQSLDYYPYGGAEDHTAPQLNTLFSPAPAPPFAHAYAVYDWIWSGVDVAPWGHVGSPLSLYPVTLLGLTTTVGTEIRLPIRYGGSAVADYPAGTTYYGMVIYASASRITIVYTSHDTVATGYTLQVENVCVDPALVNLYNQHATNRTSLPGLRYNQIFGVASGTEIKVAIRDRGTYMDPRAYKDWWVP